MKNTILKMQKIFPDAILWGRLPAFKCWIGLSLGILISSRFVPFIINIPNCLYYIGIILSITSIISMILIKKRCFQFTFSIITGILFFQLMIIPYSQKISLLSNSNNENITVYGTVISNPSFSNCQFKFQLVTDSIVTPIKVYNRKYRFICQGPVAPLYGNRISMSGSIICPERTRLPFIFNDFEYQFSNGIHGKIAFNSFKVIRSDASGLHSINKRFRSGVLDVIENFKDPHIRSILRAAFLGENNFLPDEINSKFRKSGIYHLLSISGLHAGMLIAATYFILLLLPVNTFAKHGIVLLVIWSYQILIGWSPSLLRATIMASMVICALFFEKKRYTLQSIGIAGIVLLIISPGSLFNPGYQLSFYATTGIIILFPKTNLLKVSVKPPFLEKIINNVLSSFFVSLCGFLSTAPILSYYFGTLSLFGLIANIAAVTIMTLGMWIFFLTLILQQIFPAAVLSLCNVNAFNLDLLLKIADLSNLISFSEITVPVPGTEIIILYSLILLIGGAINKKFFLKYVLYAIPVFLFLTATFAFVRYSKPVITVLRVTDNSSAHTAIRWPTGNVWLLKDPGTHKKAPMIIFNNWMRHLPGSFLEKVFSFNEKMVTGRKKLSKKVWSYNEFPEKIEQIELTDKFNYNITTTSFFKSLPCSCSIVNNSEKPSLYIAIGNISRIIMLNGPNPPKTTITLFRLDGNQSKMKTW